MTSRPFLVLALCTAIAVAPRAGAAPMYSPFSTVRSVSTQVVLGTVKVDAQGAISIAVDAVVRGTAHTGLMAVNPSPDGHLNVHDERVVAFIDASNALRWVGQLAGGPNLEAGVIRLHGFFDFNTHIVSPGIFTLAKLKTALATGAMTETFDATFAFPDGHGHLRDVPSKHFTLDYDAFNARVVNSSLSLACLDSPSVSGLDWGSFELRLSDKCLTNGTAPQNTRSLELAGEFLGVNPAGAITLRIVPNRPFMYETEYDAFARDPDIAGMTRVLDVKLPSGAVFKWRLEDSIVDAHGKVKKAGGVSSSLQQASNGKTTSTDVYDFEDIKIAITPAPITGQPGGNTRGMIQLVESGGLGSCTFTQRGSQPVTCTLSQAQPLTTHR
jgi:hypothetical protein